MSIGIRCYPRTRRMERARPLLPIRHRPRRTGSPAVICASLQHIAAMYVENGSVGIRSTSPCARTRCHRLMEASSLFGGSSRAISTASRARRRSRSSIPSAAARSMNRSIECTASQHACMTATVHATRNVRHGLLDVLCVSVRAGGTMSCMSEQIPPPPPSESENACTTCAYGCHCTAPCSCQSSCSCYCR